MTSSTPWSARVGTDVYQAEHLPCLAAQERDTALDHVVYLRVGQFISGFGGTKDATPATKLRLKGGGTLEAAACDECTSESELGPVLS